MVLPDYGPAKNLTKSTECNFSLFLRWQWDSVILGRGATEVYATIQKYMHKRNYEELGKWFLFFLPYAYRVDWSWNWQIYFLELWVRQRLLRSWVRYSTSRLHAWLCNNFIITCPAKMFCVTIELLQTHSLQTRAISSTQSSTTMAVLQLKVHNNCANLILFYQFDHVLSIL